MSLADKHPTHDPDHDNAQGAAPAPARKGPAELLRERRERIRRRRLTAAGVVLALVLAAFYVWGPTPSPHEPEPRSQGYTGTRTDTGRPSPKWTNGADIAWRLERRIPLADETAVVKSGDQVVLFHDWSEGDGTGVVSLDVSGTRPVTQWRGVLPKDSSFSPERRPVLMGNGLFVGKVRLDLATGRQGPAPWAERDQDPLSPPTIAITSGYGVVIACSKETCSGWAEEGDQWTMKWERDSTPTPMREYEYCSECGSSGTWVPLNDRDIVDWGRAADPFTEPGADSITSRNGKRIINTETGEVRSLCTDETRSDDFEVYSTTDGWVAVDSRTDQATAFAADGRPLESFTISDPAGADDHKAALPVGGQAPTSAQLRDFLTTGEAPWAEGILRALPATDDDGAKTCGKLSFTPTGSDHPTRETSDKLLNTTTRGDGQCAIRAMRASISEDHSAIQLQGRGSGKPIIIDMHGASLFHPSGTFTPVDAAKGRYSKAFRVYDDLVLVIGEEGATAFTPRGS